MKRLMTGILAIALCLALSSCGAKEDPARTAADEAIAALPYMEELSLEDEALVKAARAAVDALTEKDRDAVIDHSTIAAYEGRLEVLKRQAEEEAKAAAAEAEKAAQIQKRVGSWKNLYLDNSNEVFELVLNEDMTCRLDGEPGTWDLYEDGTLSAHADTANKAVGRLALSEDAEDARLRGVNSSTDSRVYVRAEDYDAIRDSMFLTVELTKENISEYFGPFQQIGYELDEFGKKSYPIFFTPSLAAANGLYVWEVSEDFAIQYSFTLPGLADTFTRSSVPVKFPILITDTSIVKFKEIKQVKGTVTFIRQEFVTSNTYDPDRSVRVLVLKDGTSHSLFDDIYFWRSATCSYEDWAY